MAWASVGTGGTTANTANNQATSSHTVATNNITAGRVGVLIISVDNNQTTDGDENAVSNMTDSAGNTWTKAVEFCNGQGSAQAGATVSIWFCQTTTSLNTAGTISWSFSNNASRDESCSTLWVFSVAAGNTIKVVTTNTLANDAADPGSLDGAAATANLEHLRVRGTASEVNDATQWTNTANFTNFDQTRSANVAAAMAVHGEFRIVTATTGASDPTYAAGAAADHASAYVAFAEVPNTAAFDLPDYLPIPFYRTDMVGY